MALLYEVQADDNRLVTALNLDDTPLEHDVAGISEVVAGVARLDGNAVTVAPHGWAVLSSTRTRQWEAAGAALAVV